MHTVMFACKRLNGMSREEYEHHYHEIHGGRCLLPAVRNAPDAAQ